MDAEMLKNFSVKKKNQDHQKKNHSPKRSMVSNKHDPGNSAILPNKYTERSGPRSNRQKSKSPAKKRI
jgi:hypothetical protein